MSNVRRIDRCRICDSKELVPLLSLGEQSLTGVFPRERDAELTRGPLELVKCDGGEGACGLVQLRHSFSPAEMYGDNYGYRSSINGSMRQHLRDKVRSLLTFGSLVRNDLVLDIGSNDGTTLSFYPDDLIRVGMDPAAEKFREFYQPDVLVIADFFSAKGLECEMGARKAKIVTSLAMFYDLDSPVEFAEQIASILADDGIWHFEQSYMPMMLEKTAYDTICHEHVEYYGLRQIQWVIDRCGLRILEVELNNVNGGSLAVTAAKDSSHFPSNTPAIDRVLRGEKEAGVESLSLFADFAARVSARREELISLLQQLKGKGHRVLGYGASTKGNVILQYCGITPELLPAIAEVNTDKFGCFTPGTGIPIISEKEAHELKPDYFLVMPWHFRANLVERERSYLERGGQMIFPLPTIDIVGAGGR